MLSTKIVTVLALFAASASGLSGYNPSAQHAHRRHASRAVHHAVAGARAARNADGGMLQAEIERNVVPSVGKRGIKARRCAAKTSSALPSSTPIPETSATADATTSTDPAPESTSSSSATPTKSNAPASTSKPATKTSSAAKETPTDDGDEGSSSSGGSRTGEATFYATGLGACGITNNDSDFIAAASHLLFDFFGGYTGGDPNQNPICNKKVTAHYQGKSVTVTITDRCTGCALEDLDFSPSAFNVLADPSLGRLTGMTWAFI